MVLFLYFISSLLVFSTFILYFIYFIALYFFVHTDRLFIESLLRIMRSVTSHRYSVSHDAEAECS